MQALYWNSLEFVLLVHSKGTTVVKHHNEEVWAITPRLRSPRRRNSGNALIKSKLTPNDRGGWRLQWAGAEVGTNNNL